MMAHREALKSGDEVDAITKRGRASHSWHPDERKAIKQQLRKRARRNARLALRMNEYERDHVAIRHD